MLSSGLALAAAAALQPAAGAAQVVSSDWEKVDLPVDPGVVLLDIGFTDDSHGALTALCILLQTGAVPLRCMVPALTGSRPYTCMCGHACPNGKPGFCQRFHLQTDPAGARQYQPRCRSTSDSNSCERAQCSEPCWVGRQAGGCAVSYTAGSTAVR